MWVPSSSSRWAIRDFGALTLTAAMIAPVASRTGAEAAHKRHQELMQVYSALPEFTDPTFRRMAEMTN